MSRFGRGDIHCGTLEFKFNLRLPVRDNEFGYRGEVRGKKYEIKRKRDIEIKMERWKGARRREGRGE
jgi:hypothetical protein